MEVDDLEANCYGCDKKLSQANNKDDIVICPKCNKVYCIDCDIFIHETLLTCPSCTLL